MKRPAGFDPAGDDQPVSVTQFFRRTPDRDGEAAASEASGDAPVVPGYTPLTPTGAGAADSVWDRDAAASQVRDSVRVWAGADAVSGVDAVDGPESGQGSGLSASQLIADAKTRLRDAKKLRVRAARKRRGRFARSLVERYRKFLFVLAGLGVLAGVVAVATLTPLMSVQKVTVTGVESVDQAQVTAALEKLRGKPLALVRDSDVHGALQRFKAVQSYSFETVPPDSLTVHIVERTPVLAIPAGENYRIVDPAGVTLNVAAEPGEQLPVAADKAADITSEGFRAAAAVLRDVGPELRGQVATVTATTGQDVTFELKSGVVLRWGSADDSQLKLAIYQRLVAAMPDRRFTVVDVSATQAPVFQ